MAWRSRGRTPTNGRTAIPPALTVGTSAAQTIHHISGANWEAGETIDVVVTASTSGGSASATSVPTSDVQSRNIAPATTYFPSSFWDQPIPANAPLDPQSAAMSNELLSMALGVAPMENYDCRQASYLSQTNSWSSWNSSGAGLLSSGDARRGHPNDDRHADRLHGWSEPALMPSSVIIPANTNLQAAMQSVPIPSGAEPSMGGDAQMIIWQPSSDTMWELWQTSQDSSGQWRPTGEDLMNMPPIDPGDHHSISVHRIMQHEFRCRRRRAGELGRTSAPVPNLPGYDAAQLEERPRGSRAAMAPPESRRSFVVPSGDHRPGNSIIPEEARIRIDPNLKSGCLVRKPEEPGWYAEADRADRVDNRSSNADVRRRRRE